MAKRASTTRGGGKSGGGAARSAGGGRSTGGGRSFREQPVPDAKGKQLVIVESPTKAKTINKYLGPGYVVMASVGHVRDLPKRVKGQVVPGVDVEHDFAPTYEVMPDKQKTVSGLRKAAKEASKTGGGVWFATDLDREGEAIAWHLAEALGVPLQESKRVVFNAITKGDIERAFQQPRTIDRARVDAQQARRVLDRIVGYQVSPFLWKKVAGGLSAGRVQSVAVRLVVEREREIDAFLPDEYWKITGYFAADVPRAAELAAGWARLLEQKDAKGNPPPLREQVGWLSENRALKGELVEVAGQAFKPESRDAALRVAKALGYTVVEAKEWQDPKGKGPAKFLAQFRGRVDVSRPGVKVRSIETKRTSVRPSAPFITSTLQQAAANRLGFPLQKTMRVAQQLYEGVDIHGVEGQVGLITYMRTDSTHLSGDAIGMARDYIATEPGWGQQYLPDKPQTYTSSNKSAQEAHEAIRPTDVKLTPRRVQKHLTEDQYKLYRLIWERFLACQMTPAQWDSTTVLIEAPLADQSGAAVFKSTGRTLVFDGFYKASGVPRGEDLVLPSDLREGQPVAPFHLDPTQHFTQPPPRYTEASLQKKLEEEGIGRPSTYAAIISTIQDRKYVEGVAPGDRRLRATDLGMVVTDMLVEAFPKIMDVGYTRDMERQLDKIEEEHLDWVAMLRAFYGPFRQYLELAHEMMSLAKAMSEPAPHTCPTCGAGTVYRFGRNGKFLSCSRYPDCKFAAPIDAEGNPQQPELTDVLCPLCGGRMSRRRGRFGSFLGCVNYPQCPGIVRLDPKKGTVVPPKVPPLVTDVPCPKCGGPQNLRSSKRGPWMSCSNFPKCRGRVGFSSLEEEKQNALTEALAAHEKANPVPHIHNLEGQPVGEGYIPKILTAGAAPDGAADTPTDDADTAAA